MFHGWCISTLHTSCFQEQIVIHYEPCKPSVTNNRWENISLKGCLWNKTVYGQAKVTDQLDSDIIPAASNDIKSSDYAFKLEKKIKCLWRWLCLNCYHRSPSWLVAGALLGVAYMFQCILWTFILPILTTVCFLHTFAMNTYNGSYTPSENKNTGMYRNVTGGKNNGSTPTT